MHSFNYYYTKQVNAEININDPGNCAIEAYADNGTVYYLVIKTVLGLSMIFTYGPKIIDSNVFAKSVKCTFDRIDYSESKINTIITKFLNDPNKQITQALEVSSEQALENCISIIEYVKTEEF